MTAARSELLHVRALRLLLFVSGGSMFAIGLVGVVFTATVEERYPG